MIRYRAALYLKRLICVYVKERENEKERERERENEKKREREREGNFDKLYPIFQCYI